MLRVTVGMLFACVILALPPGAAAQVHRVESRVVLSGCGTLDAPGEYVLAADVSSKGDCIKIVAGDVSLDCNGSRIEGKEFIGKGVMVNTPAPRIEIRHCRISNFLYGVEIQHGNTIHVHHNDLSNNFDDTHGSRHGAWLGLVDGGGIRVNHSTEIRIESNSANAGANGIDVRDSARVLIRGNTTNRNSANGIVLTNTSDSSIEENTVNDNLRWCTFPTERGDVVVPGCDSAGIMLQDGSSRNRVLKNVLLGPNGDGIFLRNHTTRCGDDTVIEHNEIIGAVWNSIEAGFCARIRIANNVFAKSKYGLWISFMDEVTVENNTFAEMEHAGIVLKNLHHARVQKNTFLNTTTGILLTGSTDDEKFGWTLRHPFAYYRSHSNIITHNSFAELTQAAVHLSNSTTNQISANVFRNVEIPLRED
jgi:parallel beta-helix repeat protein